MPSREEESGPIRIMPGPDFSLRGGNHMIVVGASENVSRLALAAGEPDGALATRAARP